MIEALIQSEQWQEARKEILAQLQNDPDNHWLLTNLGLTYYEEKEYSKSLEIFLDSLKIVDDCPLTLWYLAGNKFALKEYKQAAEIYFNILNSDKTHEKDYCWESADWTRCLKRDCLDNIKKCYENMGAI